MVGQIGFGPMTFRVSDEISTTELLSEIGFKVSQPHIGLVTIFAKVKWCAGMELHHPSPKAADLQSAPLLLTVYRRILVESGYLRAPLPVTAPPLV